MIDLLERFGYRPRFCVWELTLACNLKCKHCGSHAGKCRDDELTLDECLRIAGELAAAGCEKVTLGGGEPTLNPDWHVIGKRLTDLGVRVNIISNGWRWTEEHLEQARAAKLMNVAFSLDGFEEAHDGIRDRPGAYKRVIDAIDLCVKGGMPTSVITTVMKPNQDQLPELRDFLRDHGVASWQVQIGTPSGDLRDHWELVIAPEDLLWLVPLVAELRADDVERPVICPGDNLGYFGKYETTLRDRGTKISFWLGCRAGCQVIGIESHGNVKGCLSMPSARHGKDLFSEGNLRDRPLAEIWQREGGYAYNRAFKEAQLSGFCGSCRYRDICRGGCAWTAYSHTANRFDNPYCFYRQAVLHKRFDLLGDDEPNDEELALADATPAGTIPADATPADSAPPTDRSPEAPPDADGETDLLDEDFPPPNIVG